MDAVTVAGSYAYVNGTNYILDIADPANPTLVAQSITGYNAAVSGSYAYVAQGERGLKIVDISNPATPVVVGICQAHITDVDVALYESFAYVADAFFGLQAIDVSNPNSPFEVWGDLTGDAECVTVSGSYLYASNPSLQVFDLSNPLAPNLAGWHSGEGTDVAVSGGYIYMAEGSSLGIYQFIAPQIPMMISMIPVNPPVQIPATGGSFNFNVSVVRNVGPQAPFVVWARLRNPNFSYTEPTIGPLYINPPMGITISRQRTQTIPGSWSPGVYSYWGYVNTTFTYPAIDSSSFTFNKMFEGSGPDVWQAACTGDPFPGETSIAEEFQPSVFNLHPSSPNPFNPSTTISYELPAASYVSLKVYDTAGRLVATLAESWTPAGTHSATFDGSRLASGIYLAKFEAGDFTATQKLVLLK
jgi:hypothetical protein